MSRLTQEFEVVEDDGTRTTRQGMTFVQLGKLAGALTAIAAAAGLVFGWVRWVDDAEEVHVETKLNSEMRQTYQSLWSEQIQRAAQERVAEKAELEELRRRVGRSNTP